MIPDSPQEAFVPDPQKAFLQQLITLAKNEDIDGIRTMLKNVLAPQDHDYEFSEEHPALIIEGPAAEVWVPEEKKIILRTLLPLTDQSPDWQFELHELMANMRESIQKKKDWVDSQGKTMPLQDMPLKDAMEELRRIFFFQGKGRLRVYSYSTVRLD